jgi:hypothetical protein
MHQIRVMSELQFLVALVCMGLALITNSSTSTILLVVATSAAAGGLVAQLLETRAQRVRLYRGRRGRSVPVEETR